MMFVIAASYMYKTTYKNTYRNIYMYDHEYITSRITTFNHEIQLQSCSELITIHMVIINYNENYITLQLTLNNLSVCVHCDSNM